MQQKLKTKVIALLIAIVAVGLAVMGYVVSTMQTNISLESYTQEMNEDFAELPDLLTEAAAEADQNTQQYDAFYQSKAESVAFMANNNAGFEATNAKMEELRSLMNLTNLLVVTKDGAVVSRAQETTAQFGDGSFTNLLETFNTNEPSEAVDKCNLRYYSCAIDSDNMVVVEQDSTELTELIEQSGSFESVLKNITIGTHGYIVAVSADDNTILYHPDESYKGKSILDCGFSQSDLQEGSIGWKTLSGTKKYCEVKHINDVYYIAMVPESDVDSARGVTTGVILFSFLMVMALVVTYGICVLNDESRRALRGAQSSKDVEESEENSLKFAKHKTIVMSFVGFIAVVVVAFYMQTLFALSSQSITNNEHADDIVNTITRMNDEADSLQEQYNRRYLNKCQVLAYILDANPSLANKSDMQRLADVLDVQYTYTFDAEGNLASTNSSFTNYALSDDPDDYSYEFRSLLQGVDYVVQDARTDEISGELRQFIGVVLHDSDGNASGFAQIGIRPTRLADLMSNLTIDHVLDGVKVGSDGFAFSISKTDGTVTYYPEQKYIGSLASDLGITSDQIKAGFNDFITINGTQYLAASVEGDYNYVYVASAGSDLMDARVPLTGATAVVTAICLALIFVVLSWGRKSITVATTPAAKAEGEGEDRIFDVTIPDGRTVRTESIATRLLGDSLKWDEKTPEEKVGTIAKIFVGIFVIAVCIAVIFRDALFDKSSLFSYVVGGGWSRGLNIFAITASLMFACVAMTLATIVKKLLSIASESMGSRGETICRLLGSFIKYATIIGMVYYCLALLGVDTTTLLASAGILSIAISLGAKELVSDIISGLFIIFEGDFRVGDIIQVGSWSGTVAEIGVRTTKVMNGQGNIKVIRNSNVSDIVNMTKQLTYTWIDVGIEYGESLEHVESILSRELPNIAKKIPAILSGPFYKGVVSLGDSSVNIRIMVQCAEKDRGQVERDLNRAIKILFDKYDIGIPFPQVVVNQPEEKRAATLAEQYAAERFNMEQKEATKDIKADKDSGSN